MEDWCIGGNHKSWLLIFMMLSCFMVPPIQAACIEEEREALLEIKASLNDSFTYDANPLLPTWVDHGECCQWERVKCDTTTGHITELSLKNVVSIVYEDYNRIWPLNASLFLHFKELRSLNLSWNYIDNTIVTTGLERLSSLEKLERLDLSSNAIENGIFPSLSALTSLKVLDISDNSLEGNFPAHEIAALENLEELYLRYSGYSGTFQIQGSEKVFVMKKLKILDLRYNGFNESLIASLRSFQSLKALYLSNNNLNGFPVQELSHLSNLENLDLNFVGINGTPGIEACKSLRRLERLESVSLSGIHFNKSIISCLSFLPSLKILDLSRSYNMESSFSLQELSSLRELNTLDLSNCDLQSLTLNGTMSNLVHLNLDNNNFSSEIMRSMAAFPSLRFLSLEFSFAKRVAFPNSMFPTYASGGVPFPNKLPNLRDLRVLILGSNYFNGTLPMEALTSFHRLEVLDLSNNNFVGSIPPTIKLLSSLKVLSFAKNKLHGPLPNHGFCELKNLQELDLSENMFDGNLHECFNTISSLRLFDISSNQFTGPLLPSLIANLTSLEYVDFSHNKFEGLFPFSSFSNHRKLEVVEFISDNDKFEVETEEPVGWTPMFQLKVLVLSNCNVNRQKASVHPGFLVNQNKLRVLDMSHNSMQGEFPSWLIKNNTKLELLNLRNNSFKGDFHWPFYRNPNLRRLDLSGNLMISVIPRDIRNFLPYIAHLNLSRNCLDGVIPSSIGDMDQLETLDLSHNQLSGEVPTGFFTDLSRLSVLELSNNKLYGEVLSGNLSFSNIKRLHLDSNSFTGKIVNEISRKISIMSKFITHPLKVLDISNNLFTGLIPSWICNGTLSELVVRNNMLGGHFPCGIDAFWFLDISQNYFSGPIPSYLYFPIITHLHLGSNKFTGSIPNSFRNFSRVLTLDISNNNLSGKIPEYLGELSNLRILQLRKNKFTGSIPNQLCQLTKVSLIDLSSNLLSGSVPRCLQNITGPSYHAFMQSGDLTFPRDSFYKYTSVLNRKFEIHDQDSMFQTQDEVVFTTKTLSLTYKGEILDIMSGLDLSCNKLTGDIPEELGLLTQIRVLNLSHNMLTGPIPLSFSNLKKIESLDLSSNGLTGKVPIELMDLHFISTFNVSYNNLSGRLPEMKAQFSTFTKESYEGNPLLCGLPLENKCTTEPRVTQPPVEEESQHEKWYDIDMTSFYGNSGSKWFVFMLGFAALLYINPYWRRRWLDLVQECMYTCYNFFYDLVRKPFLLFRE